MGALTIVDDKALVGEAIINKYTIVNTCNDTFLVGSISRTDDVYVCKDCKMPISAFSNILDVDKIGIVDYNKYRTLIMGNPIFEYSSSYATRYNMDTYNNISMYIIPKDSVGSIIGYDEIKNNLRRYIRPMSLAQLEADEMTHLNNITVLNNNLQYLNSDHIVTKIESDKRRYLRDLYSDTKNEYYHASWWYKFRNDKPTFDENCGLLTESELDILTKVIDAEKLDITQKIVEIETALEKLNKAKNSM